MAAAGRPRAFLAVVAIAAACAFGGSAASGADVPPIDASSSDVFELVARFGSTACFVHGLIAPQDLVRLARTFRRA